MANDKWTNSAALIRGVTTFASITSSLGGIIDKFIKPTKLYLGLSSIGLGVGALIATFASWGSSYSGSIQDRNNQHQHESDSKKIKLIQVIENPEEHPIEILEEVKHEVKKENMSSALTKTQKLALAGTCVSVFSDFFSSLYFVIELGSKKGLSSTYSILLQSAAGLLSMAATVTEERTLENNMHLLNQGSALPPAASEEKSGDKWVNINSFTEFLSDSVANTFWQCQVIDTITGLSENFLGLSWTAIKIGAPISILVTLGAVYCHYIVNKRNQEATHIDPALLSHPAARLNNWQMLAIILDYITHIGEIAAPAELMTQVLSNSYEIETLIAGGFFGALGSVAQMRTCSKNLKADNAEQAIKQAETKKPEKTELEEIRVGETDLVEIDLGKADIGKIAQLGYRLLPDEDEKMQTLKMGM